MTVTESKNLKTGTRVYWRGEAADSGVVTKTSWDAVTIAWNNGHVAVVHHGTCVKFSASRRRCIWCNRRNLPPATKDERTRTADI